MQLHRNLARNAKVRGFCPHPESVVKLNLINKDPVYLKQYRIAERFHDAVTEAARAWKERGVITEIPIIRINNTLTVSQKKNMTTGMRSNDPTNIRTNFDGRHLNSRMPTYHYEIPKISEIFEQLSG